MKRIAIITNIPAPYRVDLFYYLQKNTKEYEIHVFYASQNEDNRKWKVEEGKMENSHFLKSSTIKIPSRYDTKYIHISKGIKNALRELKPAIVIGSEYNPTAVQALQYCRKEKIPYISWTDGTLHSERNINRIQRFLRRYVVRHASACLSSSTKAKEAQLVYGAREESCFTSLLTIDIEKYMVQAENRQRGRILCVGSLIERKGIDLLLKALQGIGEDYTLALAGEGPEKENIRELSRKLGIEEHVEFLGYLSQEELKEEYARSSLFVLPTREDCYALVILEAMCAALPVVASQYADGAYDLIEDGKSGYIVDPYDAEKLCGCLQGLLQNPGLAEEMGRNSLERVGQFCFERVSEGVWNALAYVSGNGLR